MKDCVGNAEMKTIKFRCHGCGFKGEVEWDNQKGRIYFVELANSHHDAMKPECPQGKLLFSGQSEKKILSLQKEIK